MMSLLLLQQATTPVFSIWGFIVPGAVFAAAFFTTLLLYRHFSKQQNTDSPNAEQ